MVKISPFAGVLYSEKKAGRLENLVSPPYDVISPSMQDKLYKASPHNIIRIILGKDLPKDGRSRNKYTRAAHFIRDWLKEGILKKEKKPAIYLYEQEYLHRAALKKRMGFIALMRIEPPEKNLILPHEYTFAKPKKDRLNLIRRTKANTEPIFCLFQDELNRVINTAKRRAGNSAPIIDVRFEGTRNKLWRLTAPKALSAIAKWLDGKQVFIADGHHRYEVSLAFRDEMRKKPGLKNSGKFDNIMVYFSSISDDNLTVLPTFRLIKNLGGMAWKEIEAQLGRYFAVKNVGTSRAMFRAMEGARPGYAFGAYFKNGKFYVLKLKDAAVLSGLAIEGKSEEWKRLDVAVLHCLVFDRILHVDRFSRNDENILYTRSEEEAVQRVDSGECEIAFFQLPAEPRQIRDIAARGEKMPHKSTYFYPKPLSGLVMNIF